MYAFGATPSKAVFSGCGAGRINAIKAPPIPSLVTAKLPEPLLSAGGGGTGA